MKNESSLVRDESFIMKRDLIAGKFGKRHAFTAVYSSAGWKTGWETTLGKPLSYESVWEFVYRFVGMPQWSGLVQILRFSCQVDYARVRLY